MYPCILYQNRRQRCFQGKKNMSLSFMYVFRKTHIFRRQYFFRRHCQKMWLFRFGDPCYNIFPIDSFVWKAPLTELILKRTYFNIATRVNFLVDSIMHPAQPACSKTYHQTVGTQQSIKWFCLSIQLLINYGFQAFVYERLKLCIPVQISSHMGVVHYWQIARYCQFSTIQHQSLISYFVVGKRGTFLVTLYFLLEKSICHLLGTSRERDNQLLPDITFDYENCLGFDICSKSYPRFYLG